MGPCASENYVMSPIQFIIWVLNLVLILLTIFTSSLLVGGLLAQAVLPNYSVLIPLL